MEHPYHYSQGVISSKRTITVVSSQGHIEITHTGFILDNHHLADTTEGNLLRQIVRFDIDAWVVSHEGERLPEVIGIDQLGHWLLHQIEHYHPARHQEG